jgi:hypothetical protein
MRNILFIIICLYSPTIMACEPCLHSLDLKDSLARADIVALTDPLIFFPILYCE